MECLSNVFDIRIFEKAQKSKQINTGHFSNEKQQQVMSSDQIMSSGSEFKADPIKNGDLFQQILDKKTQHKKTQDKKT